LLLSLSDFCRTIELKASYTCGVTSGLVASPRPHCTPPCLRETLTLSFFLQAFASARTKEKGKKALQLRETLASSFFFCGVRARATKKKGKKRRTSCERRSPCPFFSRRSLARALNLANFTALLALLLRRSRARARAHSHALSVAILPCLYAS
jgi:hypothetical protein